MSRYDGLIIPRSYSEYINKTDAATLQQALQQSGVMDAVPTAGSNNPVKSGGVKTELEKYINKTDAATLSQALQLNGVLAQEVAAGNMSAVTSNAVNGALAEYTAIPYLTFDPTNKVWAWHNYNVYNTSKPIVRGQLVAIFLEGILENTYWSSTTTGVITYPLQNTNGEKSAKTKCIGIVLDDFIDIIS